MDNSSEVSFPIFETIDEFCIIFNIGHENCSCADEELRNALSSFIGICGEPIEKVIVYEPHYSRLYAGIIVVITLFGIIGNSTVVIVAIKNWKSSIPYQKLIGQLGISDLLFAILHLWTVIHLFWTNKWIYGEPMCKVLEGSITLGSLFAVGLIFIISLERYIAIVHPFFWKYGTTKLNYTLTVLNMCVGVASVIPRYLYLELSDDGTCNERWPKRADLIYELYIVSVYFSVPLIAMFYLNLRILYSLRYNVMGSADCLRDSGISRRKNCRIMRVLISIIVAFTVLVMPNRVIMLYLVYNKYTENEVKEDAYTVLTFLALVPYSFHVAINPILYCAIDKSWRKQALDVLCFRSFNLKYRCTSIDGSNVNSLDVTRIKSGSFLNENRVNNSPLAVVTQPIYKLQPVEETCINDNTNGYFTLNEFHVNTDDAPQIKVESYLNEKYTTAGYFPLNGHHVNTFDVSERNNLNCYDYDYSIDMLSDERISTLLSECTSNLLPDPERETIL